MSDATFRNLLAVRTPLNSRGLYRVFLRERRAVADGKARACVMFPHCCFRFARRVDPAHAVHTKAMESLAIDLLLGNIDPGRVMRAQCDATDE